ncbi:MAG: hypothetical protein ACK5G7_06415 [Erysipelotrichaceae bacterium]
MKRFKRIALIAVTFIISLILGFYIFNRNQINEALRLFAMSFDGYDFSSSKNLVYEGEFANKRIQIYQQGNKLFQTIDKVMPVQGISKLEDNISNTRFIYLPAVQTLFLNNQVVNPDDTFFSSLGNYNIYYLNIGSEYYLSYLNNSCFYGDYDSNLTSYNCSDTEVRNVIGGWLVAPQQTLDLSNSLEFYSYDSLAKYNWQTDSFENEYIYLIIDENYVEVNYFEKEINSKQYYEITDAQKNELLEVLN